MARLGRRKPLQIYITILDQRKRRTGNFNLTANATSERLWLWRASVRLHLRRRLRLESRRHGLLLLVMSIGSLLNRMRLCLCLRLQLLLVLLSGGGEILRHLMGVVMVLLMKVVTIRWRSCPGSRVRVRLVVKRMCVCVRVMVVMLLLLLLLVACQGSKSSCRRGYRRFLTWQCLCSKDFALVVTLALFLCRTTLLFRAVCTTFLVVGASRLQRARLAEELAVDALASLLVETRERRIVSLTALARRVGQREGICHILSRLDVLFASSRHILTQREDEAPDVGAVDDGASEERMAGACPVVALSTSISKRGRR